MRLEVTLRVRGELWTDSMRKGVSRRRTIWASANWPRVAETSTARASVEGVSGMTLWRGWVHQYWVWAVVLVSAKMRASRQCIVAWNCKEGWGSYNPFL